MKFLVKMAFNHILQIVHYCQSVSLPVVKECWELTGAPFQHLFPLSFRVP